MLRIFVFLELIPCVTKIQLPPQFEEQIFETRPNFLQLQNNIRRERKQLERIFSLMVSTSEWLNYSLSTK